MEPHPPARWKRAVLFFLNPKVAIPLALVAVLAFSPFIYRVHQLTDFPEPADPFDVEAFGTVELSDEENAFVEYKVAMAALAQFSGRPEELKKAMEDGWPAANDDVRQWVADNRAALELWRQGTAKPASLFRQPKDRTFGDIMPIGEFRAFLQLARLEGARFEQNGDFDGAWLWYRAAFRCSRHVGQHGLAIDRILGSAMHSTIASAIVEWAVHPQVDAFLLTRAARDLEADFALTPPRSTALKVEYISNMDMLNQADTMEAVAGTTALHDRLGNLGLFLMNEPEVSRRVAQLAYANHLSQIDQPRHTRTRRLSGDFNLFELDPAAPPRVPPLLPPDEIEKFGKRTIWAYFSVSHLSQFEDSVTREEACHGALLVTLACQRFHREHERFPDGLEELLEGYLATIPIDSFSLSGELLRYRRDSDEEATVWSIGDDGRDDGGDVKQPQGNQRDVGFHINPPGAAKPQAE